jgi:hypothetical protein
MKIGPTTTRRARRVTPVAAVALAATALSAALAGASTQTTKLLEADAGKFVVRPGQIIPNADGGIIFGGPRRPGQKLGHITWQSWSKTDARGKGVEWVNNCKPDCAQGTYKNRGTIQFHAFRPRSHHFTRLTANGATPKSYRAFKLTHSGSTWFWNPVG